MRGAELATHFAVSRQILVQDIAILRAGGIDVIATPHGYVLPHVVSSRVRAVLQMRRGSEKAENKVNLLVDHGVHVLVVGVAHPVLGELVAALDVRSRQDVRDLVTGFTESKAGLLSELTGGQHTYTVEAPSEEALDRVRTALHARGYLRVDD